MRSRRLRLRAFLLYRADGQFHGNRGTAPETARDLHFAAQQGHTFPHARQTEGVLLFERSFHFETDAVILDVQP